MYYQKIYEILYRKLFPYWKIVYDIKNYFKNNGRRLHKNSSNEW